MDVAVLHSWWWSALISDLNLQPDRAQEYEDLHLECSLRSSSLCPCYFLCPELIWSLIFEAGWRLWTMWGSATRLPLPLSHSLPYLLRTLICRNFELDNVFVCRYNNSNNRLCYDECILFLSVHLTNHASLLISDIKPSITKATSFTWVRRIRDQQNKRTKSLLKTTRDRQWYVNNMKPGYCWELTWGNMALSYCRSTGAQYWLLDHFCHS